jgi:hypothetical protein
LNCFGCLTAEHSVQLDSVDVMALEKWNNDEFETIQVVT